jgi:predicted helicase
MSCGARRRIFPSIIAMPSLTLKPTHKAVSAYYDSLAKFEKIGIKHETAVRSAFQELLEICARQFDWKLVPEYPLTRKGKSPLKADGALLDNYGLNHGLWEAKDSDDDLEKEIKSKFAVGYPKENILFWQPKRAVLYQKKERHFEADLSNADDLVKILTHFLEFAPPAIAEWEKAVEEFRDKVPQIGASLKKLIEKERQTNNKFITAFEDFCLLCRGSLNPNISIEAVEEMIIQHILTERIFRKIFANADFVQRNVIAQEIEKVVSALNSRVFSRDDFSKSLEHFYGAIENAAATISDYHEKQTFLNTVYERFFQGFCVKVADTHGIVYTPQPLVNFMVASVEHILKKEFGKSLADKEVHILDPFTGTGNFIVNIMRHIPKSALQQKYANELHCNEVMLLPYYVASMNIEHAYYEATGKYESFEGICLVDTFQTINGKMSYFANGEKHEQQDMAIAFNPENTKRINRQKAAPIRVVIANPPYNAGQINENDNNKNRNYPELERRVSATYGEASKATLLRKLSDPYVKAIRFATDRIGESGIVCFVNNNSFFTDKTFDGMRKELAKDFDLIYVLDLGGNVRKNPKLSGTTHNVFGIQVGVSINLFIRLPKGKDESRKAKIYHHAVGGDWRKEQKYSFLETKADVDGVKWQKLLPDEKGNWMTNDTDEEFDSFLPIGSKEAKAGTAVPTIFKNFSCGVLTARDEWLYNFGERKLAERVKVLIENYQSELFRFKAAKKVKDIDSFVNNDLSFMKWTDRLKEALQRGAELAYEPSLNRVSLYRPFTKQRFYFDPLLVQRRYRQHELFPIAKTEKENLVVCLTESSERPFSILASNTIVNYTAGAGFGAVTRSFPLFTYSADGKARRDNVTLQARIRFQNFYDEERITQHDIFYYVYALLHHPAYRERFAENLKRDLPRIPFVSKNGMLPSLDEKTPKRTAAQNKADAEIFWAFVKAGEKLADLHVNYESAKEFKLKRVENKEVKLDWRVEAMKLTKDKLAIIYNDFLTLTGIPPEVFDYKLGNRSALDWVIDQYRVTKDENGNIVSDPNRNDDEEYIVALIGKVITVSLNTLEIISSLPPIKAEG